MALIQTEYLLRLVELRDAGQRLARLFSDAVERSSSPEEWNKGRKNLLEAELYIMRLDEVITKMSPPAPKVVLPVEHRQQYHPSDETQKLDLFLAV